MRITTRHTLNQLVNCDLFGRVGDSVEDDGIVQVATWRDAIKAHESVHWQYWMENERNRLTSELHKTCRERYNVTWNVIVNECRDIVSECVREALLRFSVIPGIDSVRINAEWNILGALMEAEYSDVISPGFFTDVVTWHFAGHYPCGRDDRFPKGRLLIY
jgi:hypothetical protein